MYTKIMLDDKLIYQGENDYPFSIGQIFGHENLECRVIYVSNTTEGRQVYAVPTKNSSSGPAAR